MGKFILSIDQSTQGTKGLIFDEKGKLVVRCDLAHEQIINEKGWVEHNPKEIFKNTLQVVKDAVEKAGIDKSDITCVGISNQRETAMMWNKTTGEPVFNAVVWQCARGKDICKRIEQSGKAKMIKERTGLNLTPYFSASKLAWILENVDGVKKLQDDKNLCIGTMDSWLVFCLTGNHFTDYSNAARTQLFNIKDLKWDEDICSLFGIETASLPEVVNSNSNFGETDFNGYFEKKIPILAVLGDSNGALFGQNCMNPGQVKATYGTGSSVMMNIGEKPIISDKGVVTSLAWSIDGKINYVLEGNINYTGSVIGWVKKDLGMLESHKEGRELPLKADKEDTTYFVPAFTGLGAPYFDSDATGLFTGITRRTGRAEMVKAAVDCIAYQISDIIRLMQSESGLEIKALRADGGPTENTYLMQFQSDMLGIEVEVPELQELSGMGAAYLAGITDGVYNKETVFDGISREYYDSKISTEKREALYDGWQKAVARARVKI